MALTPGTRLGPYEIVSPLGAGGMGEVYRARDTRLERDVAIKVLPPAVASDPDRLRRFEQEARATGQLNHPNILVVYDIGRHEGTPYVVEELLEGETLRDRVAGSPLPARKACDYAAQIARGLSAAHEKGIVHRDLKPENIFVTRDGRVKILDFGLAKLVRPEAAGSAMTDLPTAAETGPGVVLGTVGYMSPEQVRGRPADHRSDIFSLGAVLYEMLSGRRAFHADSSIETMNAILKEDPQQLAGSIEGLPPGIERVVQHCLEKNPEERFQSARDLAFDLASVEGSVSGRSQAVPAAGFTDRARARWIPAAVGIALLAAAVAGFLAGRTKVGRQADPAGSSGFVNHRYRPLTFRSGSIFTARFASDGQTIVYAASWDGSPAEVFTTRADSHGSRSLGIRNAEVLSVSKDGEIALLLGRRFTLGWMRTGRLARAPLAGGAARDILDGVHDAEWSHDGGDLAVVRVLPGEYRLEYPPGNALYSTRGWIGDIRFSPDGRHIAFMDHPGLGDDGGAVSVVDREGRKRDLAGPFSSAQGLAWTPDGSEVWFTAGETGTIRSIWGVTLDGALRVVTRAPVDLTIHDISQDGRVLLVRNNSRRGIIGLDGEGTERNLSWLDWSFLRDLSEDGRMILFEEQGEGGGPAYSVFIRPTDGSPAIRLADGSAMDLNADGSWALTARSQRRLLIAVPTGAGMEREIAFPIRVIVGHWLPDDRRFLLYGREGEEGPRFFLGEEDGTVRPVTPEGMDLYGSVSPDGSHLAANPAGEPPGIYPLDGGEPGALPGAVAGEQVIRWTPDGRGIWVRDRGLPTLIHRIDVTSGERTILRELKPADAAGVLDLWPVYLSRDGRTTAYSYRRVLSTLYLAE